MCLYLRRVGPVPAGGQGAGDEVASHWGGGAFPLPVGRRPEGL